MSHSRPQSRWLAPIALAGALLSSGAIAQSQDDIFKKVFGNKAQAQRQIDAEVLLNGMVLGRVAITIKGKALVSLDLAELQTLLGDVLDDATTDCLAGASVQPQALDQTATCGVKISYDAAALKLIVDVSAAHRREQRLSVRPPRKQPQPTATDAQLAAFVNLSASARALANGRTTASSEALALDGALRWRGATFEFDGLCASDGGCVPGLRSLVFDQPRQLRRWRLGDLPDVHVGGIGVPALRGLSVGTAFELAPAQSYTPEISAPLELNTPTTVEVVVNNRTVQRYQLPAGRYSLRDFPLAFGANAAQLRMTDAAGRVQTRDLEAFVDLELLDESRSRYGVALGQPVLPLMDGAGELRPWMLAAEYARGIGPRTTLSAAAASIPGRQRSIAQFGVTHALGYWLVGSDWSCSAGSGTGCRGDLRFRRGGDPGDPGHGWRYEGALDWRQAGYVDLLGQPIGADRAGALLRASRTLGDHYALSLGARGNWERSAGSNGIFSAQIAGRLSNQLSFRADVERDVGGALRDTRITVSLSWLFDRARQSVQVDAESPGALQSARWQINRATMRGGYSATVGAVHAQDASSQDLATSYREERFGADMSVGRFAPVGAPVAQDTRVNVRSALVYADGQWGVTERVLGAFALVVPIDPKAAGTVYVNPVDDDYLASSRGPGPAVIPSLRPYETRSWVLAMPELARDHDPGELFPVTLAGYKGGVLIHAGGGVTVRLQARILDAEGKPLEMLSGQLDPAAGGTPIPVFAGRGGRLRASGISTGRWILVLDTRPQRRHELIVPASAAGLIDLGDLTP